MTASSKADELIEIEGKWCSEPYRGYAVVTMEHPSGV